MTLPDTHNGAIRVLLVEDSPSTRQSLEAILNRDGCLSVVAAVQDGAEAVAFVRHNRPDVVLMDVQMPRLDGYEATRIIMAEQPVPIVLMSASFEPTQVERSFLALEAGAITLKGKPPAPGDAGFGAYCTDLCRTLRLMSEIRVVKRRLPVRAVQPKQELERSAPATVKAIAIAASTGGPKVLQQILAGLPAAFPVPILIVQHMAEGFIPGLVRWLDRQLDLAVVLGEDGQHAEPGTVYIAPDGRHLGIDRAARLCLADGEPVDGFRPSATYLFHSLAEAFGRNGLGILLTGMGRDGASGLLDLHRKGGLTVAQDRASCAVHGMPGEAQRLGAARFVLPPDAISKLLLDCRDHSRKGDHD